MRKDQGRGEGSRIEDWNAFFHDAPVIAAVRDDEQLSHALRTAVRAVFLLGGDLFALPERVARAKAAGKRTFVHMDLVEGVSRDAAGVRALARMAAPDGLLTTRAPLSRVASECGLFSVLRIFMVDRSSLETGARMIKAGAPDLVEVMPGLVTRAIGSLRQTIAQPVIAGGMLTQWSDVRAALRVGALAASTSASALWEMQGREREE